LKICLVNHLSQQPLYQLFRIERISGIGLYQLCRSRSPSRSVYADLSQQLESIPIQTTKPSTVQSQAPQAPSTMFSSSTPQSSRPMRPRDIRIMSASPIPKSPTDHHLSSSSKHTSSNRRTVSSGVNAQLTSAMTIDDVPQMTSTPTSKKKLHFQMMVAPQPHYRSHHKERNDDSCRVNSIDHSMVQRRQSAGAIVPTFASTQYQDSRRSYCRDNPLMVGPSGDQVFYVDDRTPRSKSGGDDIRVAVLEQRVRELETAMIGGMQSPSTSAASASFMIPVVGTKGGRMLTQSSGQLLVTPSGLSSTQQLMAKEIVDKEVEIER
uniref:Potassium voltage-gated channel protein Shal n=1 Tax=Anisakis simplex TaxID=6269 RepID=A0A0M3K7T7_ANISI